MEAFGQAAACHNESSRSPGRGLGKIGFAYGQIAFGGTVSSVPSSGAEVTGARRQGWGAASGSIRLGLLVFGLLVGSAAYIDASSHGVPPDLSLSVLAGYSWAYLVAGSCAWYARPDTGSAAL